MKNTPTLFTKNIQNVKFAIAKEAQKRYYGDEDKLSNQRKIYYEKNKDQILQKQNDRYIHFKELIRTYVELENRIKSIGRQ